MNTQTSPGDGSLHLAPIRRRYRLTAWLGNRTMESKSDDEDILVMAARALLAFGFDSANVTGCDKMPERPTPDASAGSSDQP